MARKPVPTATEVAAKDTVTVRVLPRGDGKIATGEEEFFLNEETGDYQFPTYSRGDTFEVLRPIAEELEERGFGEIVS